MRDPTVVDLVLLNAVRQLAADARRTAARLEPGSPEHDFYEGVQAGAARHLQPGLMAGEPDLDRRRPAFRDGYLEASTIIGVAASGTPPLRLPLPRFGS